MFNVVLDHNFDHYNKVYSYSPLYYALFSICQHRNFTNLKCLYSSANIRICRTWYICALIQALQAHIPKLATTAFFLHLITFHLSPESLVETCQHIPYYRHHHLFNILDNRRSVTNKWLYSALFSEDISAFDSKGLIKVHLDTLKVVVPIRHYRV